MPSLPRYGNPEAGQNGGQSSKFNLLKRLLQVTPMTETFQILEYLRGLLGLSICKI